MAHNYSSNNFTWSPVTSYQLPVTSYYKSKLAVTSVKVSQLSWHFFWWHIMTHGIIFRGCHESLVTCNDSRVMNHDLAVTPKPVNQLSWNFFWWNILTQGIILHGHHDSWVTCHDSRVMNHDLFVTPKPVNQLIWNFLWWHILTQGIIYLVVISHG